MSLNKQTIVQFAIWIGCGIIGMFLGDLTVGLWIGVIFALLVVIINALYLFRNK